MYTETFLALFLAAGAFAQEGGDRNLTEALGSNDDLSSLVST